MDPLSLSIIIVVLILLSGFFSGTETAFSCANKIKLKSFAALGKRNAKAVSDFADKNYDKLVTTILIGNNIVNLTASGLATNLFFELLQGICCEFLGNFSQNGASRYKARQVDLL